MKPRISIAYVRAREGDPNEKPMTLDEFVARQRAEQGRMPKEVFRQIEAMLASRQADESVH